VTLVERSFGRFANDGEGFTLDIAEGFTVGKPLSELVRLGPKFAVAESFELGLQLVHTIDELLEFLQLLSLTGAEDFAEDRHESNILGVC